MNNKYIYAGVLVAMFSLNAAFDLFAFNDKFPTISAGETLVEIKKGGETLILDVRTPEEFTGPLGHLKGAKLIPVQELGKRLGELEKYRDKKILVICRSGYRSRNAARFLVENGFKDVINVGPGMQGMSRLQGAPIER
jgi:rhodanese-related sulfurtransferase